MSDVQTHNPGVNYATRKNIKVQQTDQEVWYEEQAREFSDRLGGQFEGGRVVLPAEEALLEGSGVLTLQNGSADQDENQLIVLPEAVTGTFTVTLAHSGGSGTTTAVPIGAAAATLQAAIDVVTGAANEVVVTKVTGRNIYGLTWSSATEDLTDHAQSTIAVTVVGEATPELDTAT